jgi:hypothetical protein
MEIETNSNIGELVRSAERNYVNGTTTQSKYVDLNMYEEVNTIDAYLNSKHTSGSTDSKDREKPFFNISIAKRNVWYRATDIDRKDIRIPATKRADVISSFLANAKLHEWMDRVNFGQFLNDWGLGLAGYGSYISKFIEKDGVLYAMNMSWQKMIVDTIDFEGNPKIEILELTPAQLRRRKGYDKEMVENLIAAVSERKLLDGNTKQDNNSDYIRLYETHGELPLAWITGDEEDEEYVQQMQVISFVASKEEGKFDDFVLVKGREDIDHYFITHLIKADGYTLSTGSVKSLFENQWMVNHTAKAIKDQLDQASKIIYQTCDPSFVGLNALTSLDNGDFLIWDKNIPNGQLSQLNNNSHDITALMNQSNQWNSLSNEIAGVSEAMLGDTPPSGTPYRQTEMLLSESHSLFKLMKQNKGLALEEMMRKYIIPHLVKQLDTTDEVVATLDTYGIDKIDEIYLKNEPIRRTNRRLVEEVIKRGETGQELPSQEDQAMMMEEETQNVSNELQSMGEQRFIKPSDEPNKTWKELFKDFEWGAKVEITDENSNKDTVLTTLNSFISLFSNPNIAQAMQTNPAVKIAVNKLLNATGELSEMELSSIKNNPSPAMAQPMAMGK